MSLRNKVVADESRSLEAGKLRAFRNPEVPVSRVAEDTDGPDPSLWTLKNGGELPGLAERVRGSLYGTVPGKGSAGVEGDDGVGGAEWPRRLRLRTRLGKRCRKDLAAGRAGILIKATFNPLEGDSSAKVSGSIRASRAGGRRLGCETTSK